MSDDKTGVNRALDGLSGLSASFRRRDWRCMLWLRRSIEASLAVTAIWIAWSSVSSYRLQARQAATPLTAATPVTPNTAAHKAGASDAHLFGVSAVASGPRATASYANISVDGIIYTPDHTGSLAMLSMDGTSRSFGIGEALPDGETVRDIEPAAVVLDRFGETRRIEMDIKGADANARFAMLQMGDTGTGSWADAYASAPSDTTASKPTAHAAAMIHVVAAAAPMLKGSGALTLNQIRAQRMKRFANVPGLPLPVQARHKP